MRKSILKWSLVGALLFSTPLQFVSCKDYDDDIEALQNKNSELTKQLSTLDGALKAANDAIAQAKAAADEAKAAGDKAAEAAALAQQAASQAKAEAIAEVMSQINGLLADKASKAELQELAGKVAGIESALNVLGDVQELAQWKTAIGVQMQALETFKTLAEQRLGALEGNVSTLLTQLGELQTKVNSNSTELANIKSQLETISESINSTVDGALNTLAGVLSLRLTSVTLVPSVYIDGIPAIDFRTAKYSAKRWDNARGKLVETSTVYSVSNGSTKVKYRLNPTALTIEDINKEGMGYVNEVAESRSGSEANKLIKVTDASINDGILTVVTDKTKPEESLVLSGNKMNIVALKVPIAEKNLLKGENPATAVVYSEYMRLTESNFRPEIGSVKSPVYHWADSTEAYTSSLTNTTDFTVTLKYNQKLDLNTLVAGCALEGEKHSNMTLDELKSFGLELRYAIASGAYLADDGVTDQQKFGAIEGSVVSSKTPSGATDQRASIGKQPIVRVTLVDVVRGTSEKPVVVDQRYLKVKFVEEELGVKDLGVIGEFTANLSCANISRSIDWVTITEKVYVALGVSKDEFARIYTENPVIEGIGTVTSYLNGNSTTGAATHPLTWDLTIHDIRTIPVNPGYKDFVVTLSFVDPKGLNPTVKVSMKIRVSLQMPTVALFGNYWLDMGNTYRVLPIQYNTTGAQSTCVYNWDAWTPFVLNGYNSIVTFPNADFRSCSTWDMQFDANQCGLSGYSVNDPSSNPSNTGNYKLAKGGETAMTLTWDAGHEAFVTLPAKPTASTVMTIEKNAAGKGVIGKKVKMGIWADINKYNRVLVKSYDLQIVPPIKTIASELAGEFVDGVISGSEIDCSSAFTMKDFRDYVVAKTATGSSELEKYAAELYNYYEVQDPVWDTENAQIGYKKDAQGNLVPDDNAKMPLKDVYPNASVTKVGNKLVFKNNGGNAIEQVCYIYVPVTVEYGWGSASQNVKIKVNPGAIITGASRK